MELIIADSLKDDSSRSLDILYYSTERYACHKKDLTSTGRTGNVRKKYLSHFNQSLAFIRSDEDLNKNSIMGQCTHFFHFDIHFKDIQTSTINVSHQFVNIIFTNRSISKDKGLKGHNLPMCCFLKHPIMSI